MPIQIISPSPRAMQAGQIGQAMGMGLAKNFPDPQQLVQRGQLAEAFEKFKTSSKDPNASPLDLSMGFLQAIAGIPGAERYAGQVLPLVLKEAQAQRGASINKPGQNQQMPPTNQENVTTQQVAPSSSSQFLQQANAQIPNLIPPDQENPNLFAGTLEPTNFGMGPLPKTYSPEAIQQMRIEDMQAGFPDSPRAQMAEQYNDLSRKEIQDYTQAAQTQSMIAQQARDSQEAFRTVLSETIGTKDQTSLALAENIAQKPEYRNIANDVLRAEKVKREYDLVSKTLEGFKKASMRPSPYGLRRDIYDRNFDVLHENSKPLIENGMRPQLQELLKENGWTDTEVTQILNPLGTEVISKVNSLPYVGQSSEFFNQSPISKKAVDSNINKWENTLANVIKPGKLDPKTRDTLTPGTSLSLLRNEWMKKGGGWREFNDMLQGLIKIGRIKLDKYQQDEMNNLAQPPIDTLTIDEFIFGTKSK